MMGETKRVVSPFRARSEYPLGRERSNNDGRNESFPKRHTWIWTCQHWESERVVDGLSGQSKARVVSRCGACGVFFGDVLRCSWCCDGRSVAEPVMKSRSFRMGVWTCRPSNLGTSTTSTQHVMLYTPIISTIVYSQFKRSYGGEKSSFRCSSGAFKSVFDAKTATVNVFSLRQEQHVIISRMPHSPEPSHQNNGLTVENPYHETHICDEFCRFAASGHIRRTFLSCTATCGELIQQTAAI